MREVTITKTYNVYDFSELSEEAKEKAKEWWLDGQEPEIFTENCEENLAYLFPNSDLKVQYSLAYCQGDGLNIYGELDPLDVITLLREKKCGDTFSEVNKAFTTREEKIIKAYIKIFRFKISLPMNTSGYSYCVADKTDFANEWIEELEYARFRSIKAEALRKFERIIAYIFRELAAQYEKAGYEYFYEISDKDMEEICESNEYMFLKDGTYFVA